jgi:hypothetical protein
MQREAIVMSSGTIPAFGVIIQQLSSHHKLGANDLLFLKNVMGFCGKVQNIDVTDLSLRILSTESNNGIIKINN